MSKSKLTLIVLSLLMMMTLASKVLAVRGISAVDVDIIDEGDDYIKIDVRGVSMDNYSAANFPNATALTLQVEHDDNEYPDLLLDIFAHTIAQVKAMDECVGWMEEDEFEYEYIETLASNVTYYGEERVRLYEDNNYFIIICLCNTTSPTATVLAEFVDFAILDIDAEEINEMLEEEVKEKKVVKESETVNEIYYSLEDFLRDYGFWLFIAGASAAVSAIIIMMKRQ